MSEGRKTWRYRRDRRLGDRWLAQVRDVGVCWKLDPTCCLEGVPNEDIWRSQLGDVEGGRRGEKYIL